MRWTFVYDQTFVYYKFVDKNQLKSVDESSGVDKNLGIDIITDSVSKMGFNRIQNHATSSQKKALISWLAFFSS